MSIYDLLVDDEEAYPRGPGMLPYGPQPEPPAVSPRSLPYAPEPAPQFNEGFGSRLLAALGDQLGNLRLQTDPRMSGAGVAGLLGLLAAGRALTAPAQEKRAVNQALQKGKIERSTLREKRRLEDEADITKRRREYGDKRFESQLNREEERLKSQLRIEEERARPVKPEKAGTGAYDPDTIFKFNTAIRSDKDISNFQDIRSGYDRVRTGARSKTPQGDIALIFGYMKMLDPGSVVREGEYANAQNSAGVPEMVRLRYNQLLSGDKLTNDQREKFKQEAQAQYTASLTQYRRATDLYRRQAAVFDPTGSLGRVVLRDYEVAPEAPARGPIVPGAEVNFVLVNGKLVPQP